MTQSGYYHRQGGPYPPATHELPSITTGRHQAAAYAGLCIYDADIFPEEYRGAFLMGNLHGSAINRDSITRNGSTYRSEKMRRILPRPMTHGLCRCRRRSGRTGACT